MCNLDVGARRRSCRIDARAARRTAISSIGILKHKAIVQRLGRYADVGAMPAMLMLDALLTVSRISRG